MQLLGDIEGLKAAQELRPGGTQGTSINSYDNLRTVPEGYEPEGQAGTGSTQRTGSGYFTNTNPPSRQPSAMRGGAEGSRMAEHRISTVQEADEEMMGHYDPADRSPAFDKDDPLLTPTRQSPRYHPKQNDDLLTPNRDTIRGTSVPLDTPPEVSVAYGAHSNDNTPKTEKSKKHKSTSSSIFPKISRWSETTASTVARQFRGSGGRKNQKDYFEAASRSGSDVGSWGADRHDPTGADRLPMSYSREQTPTGQQPVSPMVPTDDKLTSEEDARYQAHRNSLVLEHPQPRPGPSYRYQSQLESEAQNYGYTGSNVSSAPGSAANLNRFSDSAGNRYSGGPGNLSPISDRGYSPVSASDERRGSAGQAPPRPPKVAADEDLLVPPPKSRARESVGSYKSSPLSSSQQLPATLEAGGDGGRSYSGHFSQGSPRNTSGQQFPTGVPARKPMGARPLSSAGSQGQASQGHGGRSQNRGEYSPCLRRESTTGADGDARHIRRSGSRTARAGRGRHLLTSSKGPCSDRSAAPWRYLISSDHLSKMFPFVHMPRFHESVPRASSALCCVRLRA